MRLAILVQNVNVNMIMNRLYILIVTIGFTVVNCSLSAQTTWTGPMTTFTKDNFADWTTSTNQDSITNNVKLTRADTAGIFNMASELAYTKNSSPADTEWAFGTTADLGSLTFQDWQTAVDSKPPDMVNKDMVLHLITDNIYIDIKFTAWTKGRDGGGFSYQRSTDNTTNAVNFRVYKRIKLFPNPSHDYILISGLKKTENYAVYNILGKRVLEGTVSDNQKINIQDVTEGVYLFKLESGNILKFIKR